jgi:hypothetical protein
MSRWGKAFRTSCDVADACIETPTAFVSNRRARLPSPIAAILVVVNVHSILERAGLEAESQVKSVQYL